jgi:hypothetical protein
MAGVAFFSRLGCVQKLWWADQSAREAKWFKISLECPLDATLADDIRAERLARSIDIQRLAAGLRGQVENEGVTAEPTQPESVPMTTEDGVKKIVVAHLRENVPIPPNTVPKKPVKTTPKSGETKPKQLVLPKIKKHGDA